ncbi:DUF4232 domain-containing protein [Yinghuangia sp. YIM S09857]|uniref:DUF4232 domain-containing protein n=1 Tax=Yinghuangia sp. YIM S09857 TaxID=3436929 RepID=UPI003F533FD9
MRTPRTDRALATAAAAAFLPLAGLAAAPAVGAAASTPATAAAALPPPCVQDDLSVEARQIPPIARAVVLVRVVNQGPACTVDRFPTVTFGGLDGSARPEPPASSARHALDPGEEVYAAIGTDDRSGNTRYAPTLTVAADPAHIGTTFSAREIGASPRGIAVYDPITTWWHGSPDAALAALPR